MTRLVHLAAYPRPQAGSFIPFMRSVLDAAQARGWDVVAVLPTEAAGREWIGQFEDAEISVEYAYGSRRSLTRWLRGRLKDSDEQTILHTHFTGYDVPAALAARGRPNVEVYWHIHTVLSDRPRARLANALKFSLIGRGVKRVLTPSSDVADELVKRGTKREKVSVFPNAIDAEAFQPASPEQRARLRQELGIPEGPDVLLHFGRDWYLKDGDIFLDALAILIEQGRSVIGLVNQGGEAAQRAAELRDLEAHVRLVGLFPQPQKLYGAADLMVASSRGEGMPFAMIEALCSGLPVVASDLPGHRFMGDRVESCAIVSRDASKMATAIAAFLDMRSEARAALGESAHRWIAENLDLRAAAERLLDDYEQTLRESGSHATVSR
ncbi:MAG: glycosyltransferase family 4 protein [Solirubrobacterales bacterium]